MDEIKKKGCLQIIDKILNTPLTKCLSLDKIEEIPDEKLPPDILYFKRNFSDLPTIKKKLTQNEYITVDQFKNDVENFFDTTNICYLGYNEILSYAAVYLKCKFQENFQKTFCVNDLRCLQDDIKKLMYFVTNKACRVGRLTDKLSSLRPTNKYRIERIEYYNRITSEEMCGILNKEYKFITTKLECLKKRIQEKRREQLRLADLAATATPRKEGRRLMRLNEQNIKKQTQCQNLGRAIKEVTNIPERPDKPIDTPLPVFWQ
ncbi:MAG: hypothetical protein J6C50_03275 [Rickettsiales bacterium]|nr:hypothetical protein [Rickettsiales bacterium]